MAENGKKLIAGKISEEVVSEIAKIVGHDGEKDYLEEEMNVVIDERKQYTVRIPKKFAELADLKKTDKFIFTLISPKEEGGQFSIAAELKRG